ncbi:MAG: hypothetical protein EON54_02180 [Alcaligenaceae bacterium]|nr:MAG: hypothetical protein EON54_02180 [Alcaligenaceae bacterium]
MFLVLTWLFVAVLLAIWSFGIWVLEATAAWTLSNASDMAAKTTDIAGLPIPPWLTPWMPPEVTQWFASLVGSLPAMVEALDRAVPMLADGLSVMSWMVWAIGCAVLLLIGIGMHALVARAGVRPRTRTDAVAESNDKPGLARD